jgi:two-component system, NtrC family, sensor kinase
MGTPLDILILEDQPADAELLVAELHRAGLDFNWSCAGSRAAYLACLENHFDLILADYSLPQFNAIDALGLLQQRRLDIPMIVVTGHVGEEAVVECLKQGAADYLIKDRLSRLGQAVERALEQKRLRVAKERAEASLQESQERFIRLVDSTEDYIYSLDRNSRFTSANNSFCRALGISEAAIVGRTHEELGFSVQKDREWQELIEQVLSTRENVRIEINTPMPDGFLHIFDVILTPLFDRFGAAIGVAGINRDITVKALLLEEANHRAAEMEAISRVSSAMRIAHTRVELITVVIDLFFNLLQVNCAAIGTYQLESREIWIEQGRGFCSEWKGRRVSAEAGMFGRAITSGRPDFSQNIQNDIDELGLPVEGKPVAMACAPLVSSEQTVGILWTSSLQPFTELHVSLFTAIANMTANALHRQSLYDDLQTQIEALRAAQTRLVQSEKLAAVGELVAGVSHELNNPLTSVLLYAQLIQQQNIPPELALSAEKIASEAIRAASIVRGLLDFARQRPAERKPSSINDILQKCIDLIAYELRSNSIQWVLDLSPALPITMVDPHQLQQVFINVLNNSWQAMCATHKQGLLRITTGIGPSTFFAGRADEPDMIRITIQDNGPGIPRELLLRIFDPFYTTKPDGQGTGLGLSICHGIIAEHDGHIWAESEVGQGATIFIELPIVSLEVIHPPVEKPIADTPPSAVARILIVDDEISVLDVLTLALQRKGYSVETASDGTKALARLYRNPYDVIVCDIRMPELNGPDFYWQIQEKDPDLAKRVIFTTGDMLNPATRRFIDETGNQLLAKPFGLEELIEHINLVLRRHAASTEAG